MEEGAEDPCVRFHPDLILSPYHIKAFLLQLTDEKLTLSYIKLDNVRTQDHRGVDYFLIHLCPSSWHNADLVFRCSKFP
jgi:hypothetical protein